MGDREQISKCGVKPGMERILHVMHDDKFNDRAVIRFEEVYAGKNDYLAVCKENKRLQFIKSNQVRPVSESYVVNLLGGSSYRAVIFHSLPPLQQAVFRAVPKHTPIVWIGWGFDYYSTLLSASFPHPDGLFEPKTIAHFELKPRNVSFRSTIKAKLRPWLGGKSPAGFSRQDYQRVSVFVPVLKAEWQLARQENPWFKADYRPWLYALEQEAQFEKEIFADAANILVGNSASMTNNHIDSFEAIAESLLASDYEAVIVPLSYGSPRVRDAVVKAGRHYFGAKFRPILDFLEMNAYLDLVRSCHTVFMNHVRQQALANLSYAFSWGAKVVINQRSMLVNEFKERGLEFGLMDDPQSWQIESGVRVRNRQKQREIRDRKRDPKILQDFIAAL